jgi:hypothetical protein
VREAEPDLDRAWFLAPGFFGRGFPEVDHGTSSRQTYKTQNLLRLEAKFCQHTSTYSKVYLDETEHWIYGPPGSLKRYGVEIR